MSVDRRGDNIYTSPARGRRNTGGDVRAETTRQRAILAVVILAVFLIAEFAARPVVVLLAPDITGYPRWLATAALSVAICLLAVMLLCSVRVTAALHEMRMRRSPLAAVLFAFTVTLPMPVAFAFSGPMSEAVDPMRLLFYAGIGPLSEEVVFRGFAFWMLYRLARWNFWPAALIPAAFFALGHLYQANDVMSALGILAITAIGSVWFSWLLVRWDNLWVPLAMHAFMNGWWLVFEVDSTALGGWMPTLVRSLVVALSILFTWYSRRLLAPPKDALREHA
jgi:uncharacterized protein